MILKFDIDLHLLGPLLEVLDRIDELRCRLIVILPPHNEPAPEEAHHVSFASVFQREIGQGAGRMSGNQDRSYRLVAEGDGLPFHGYHIPFRGRLRGRTPRRSLGDEIPIERRHDHMRSVTFLQ